jgi:AraC-like DNA-binding protein
MVAFANRSSATSRHDVPAGRDSTNIGPVRLARLTGSKGPFSLPTNEIARDKRSSILFQLTGRVRLAQLGNQVELAVGDASLCDHSVPCELEIVEAASLLILDVPTSMLKEHLPSPEWYCARRLPGERGVSAAIMTMIGALLDEAGERLDAAHQLRIARHLLDLVATAYAISFAAQEASSSILIGRHATVKQYIEQNLRDPDLSPCSVSTSLRLSPRYLRLIFAESNETVSAYILRRRLEECAKQIADPRWRGHSMTEIAFAWGFNSAPHFTRSFRDRFATTPRDYRRTHLDAADGAEEPIAA